MKAVLEGLLFIVGDEGLNTKQLCDILEMKETDVLNLINELEIEYDTSDRGLCIKKLGESYKLTTKKEHKEYYQKLSEISDVRNLSQSALETLAIIAYNEPITRIEVDNLRGVSSAQMIRSLIAKDFVKELGKSDLPGKPNLYGITPEFLDYFGLSSKDELPKVEMKKEIQDDNIELYTSKYKEDEVL